MKNTLQLELRGPCTEESETKPGLNDTVGVILDDGRVRIMTISGAVPTPEGMVLYATGGEKVALTDCYLLYPSGFATDD
jgi:hypothetical protein